MADNTLDIEFSLLGLAKVLAGFKAVGAAADAAGKKVNALTGGNSPSGPMTSRGVRPLSVASPGAQMRLASQQQMASARLQAQNIRNETLNIRLQQAKDRAEKANARKSGGQYSFFKRLNTFVRSTRFGSGGGLMPLVGQTADLLGEAGPAGLALAGLAKVAMEAGKAVKELADNSAASNGAFSRLQHSTGGTAMETARVKATAGALGLDPGDLAGTASSISNNAGSGGFASVYASRAGIAPTPGIYHTDQSADLIKAIKYIRSSSNIDATNFARSLGAENLLPVRDMTGPVYQKVLKNAQGDTSAFNKTSIQNSAAYVAATSSFSGAVDRFQAIVGGKAQPLLTRATNSLTGGVNGATRDVQRDGIRGALGEMKFPAWLRNPINTLMGRADMDKPLGKASVAAATGGTSPQAAMKAQDAHTAALAAHTAALNKNAKAASNARPGNYGKTSRGDALGDGQTGMSLHKALEKDGFQLGAF